VRSFHTGFVGVSVLCDLAAAAIFLVSSTFDEVEVGPVATNLLFFFALVCGVLLVVIAGPLVRSSRLIHDDWLAFLIEHQLFLHSELASPANANALNEKQRQNYREQVQQLDAKIQQMRAQPAHIKVLGVEATTGSLARVLAAVAGSLLSGLMRQAADADS
jgi:thiol:disulfide interchange protein